MGLPRAFLGLYLGSTRAEAQVRWGGGRGRPVCWPSPRPCQRGPQGSPAFLPAARAWQWRGGFCHSDHRHSRSWAAFSARIRPGLSVFALCVLSAALPARRALPCSLEVSKPAARAVECGLSFHPRAARPAGSISPAEEQTKNQKYPPPKNTPRCETLSEKVWPISLK